MRLGGRDSFCLRPPKTHSGGLTTIAIIGVGPLLAGSDSGELLMWPKLNRSTDPLVLSRRLGIITAIGVSEDCRLAAVASTTGHIDLWDLSAFKIKGTIAAHKHTVTCLALTPDGRKLISASEDMTTKVSDTETAQMLWVHESSMTRTTALTVSSDGLKLISGNTDGATILWDLEGPTQTRQLSLQLGCVRAIAAEAAGQFAISGSDDRTIRISPMDIGAPSYTLVGHTDRITSLAVVKSLQGRRQCSSASLDGTVRLWDIDQGEPTTNFAPMNSAVVGIGPIDSRSVSAFTRDGVSNTVDLRSGSFSRPGAIRQSRIAGFARSSQEGIVAVYDNDTYALEVWNLKATKCLQTHTLDTRITGATFEAAGLSLIAVCQDVSVSVLSPFSHKILSRAWLSSDRAVYNLAATSTYHFFLATSWDNNLTLFDAQSGSISRRVPHPNANRVTALASHCQSRLFFTGTDLGCVAKWDAGRLAITDQERLDAGAINAIDVSSDGRFLAVGCSSNMVALFSTSPFVKLAEFFCDAPVTSCYVRPSGELLVVGDRTGRVHILAPNASLCLPHQKTGKRLI